MYRKILVITLPVFKPQHIAHAILQFIMAPKPWVHIFRLNAGSCFFLCKFFLPLFSRKACTQGLVIERQLIQIATSIYVYISIHLFLTTRLKNISPTSRFVFKILRCMTKFNFHRLVQLDSSISCYIFLHPEHEE